MNVLVTGANGFLGQHLCLALLSEGHTLVATSRGASRIPSQNLSYLPMELTDRSAVSRILNDQNPDVIIHTAAMSKPDACEANRPLCLQQNVETTQNLLEVCGLQKKQPRFLYISTDFVFGENGPHREEDIPAPLNFYGESKLKAEMLVTKYAENNTIIRPVFIYGQIWEGLRPSFPHWVKTNLEQGKKIKVVSDQRRTPTFVSDICKGILAILKQNRNGVYHLAGKDLISPYEMAVTTANILKLDAALIENVTSEIFKEPVVRAKRSGLLIEKARKDLGYDPVSFEAGIQRTFFKS